MEVIVVGKFKGFNNYEIREDITIIFIVNRKGEKFEAILNTEDLQQLIDLDYPWHVKWDNWSKTYYIKTTLCFGEPGNRKTKPLHLHSLLMNVEEGISVDHENHNGLDNTKINLRIVDKPNNAANRKGANNNSKTGVRNVNYIEKLNEYWVQIMRKGERFRWVFPGNQFKEACDFADIKRKEIFGDYAGNS